MPDQASDDGDIVFGVIIPTYNRPQIIGEAIVSLMEQTHTAWIAVIVDDASHEDYSQIRQLISTDSRLHYLRREKNGGVNQSCNSGLDWFHGQGEADFLTFMDDDDTYAPDYFSMASKVIKARPQYGWFISNNFGDQKSSSRRIMKEMELDYIDDYIYGKFRGDKGRLIASELLKQTRMSGHHRSSHRWPFFTSIALRTRIWAFPHDSVQKRYLENGITLSKGRHLEFRSIFHNVYKHIYIIRHRPFTTKAYKYLLLESLKVAPRLLRLAWRKLAPRA